MAFNSEIQWTNATVNFWTGCKKVSDGCKFCYMYRDKERYGQDPKTVLRTSDKTFYAAIKWQEPKLIFTCSWSDFFIEEADEWRSDAWDVIRKTPHHTWQILTKRPERIKQCLPDDWGEGWSNVWIGVTVENEKAFDERIPILDSIEAKTKFVSFEPLIGRIEINENRRTMMAGNVDWAIVGGESGNENGKYQYRESELEWFEHIIDMSPRYTNVFVKQLGTHLAKKMGLKDRHGGDISEFPDNLQVREMPRSYSLLLR